MKREATELSDNGCVYALTYTVSSDSQLQESKHTYLVQRLTMKKQIVAINHEET